MPEAVTPPAPEPAGEAPPGEAPVSEETPQQQLEGLRDQNLRLQAEFDNYRKRQAREFHRLCSQGRKDLILELLHILDDIDRARLHQMEGAPVEELLAGMMQVAAKLESILGREGLEAMSMEPMCTFDPNLHEAVVAEPVSDSPHDVVLEVLRKGYTLDSELLRPAMVRVGKPVKPAQDDTREE